MQVNESGHEHTMGTMHAFGVLSTRLNDAVARACQVLDAHAGVLPAGTLADLDELRAEFERRRVRIAVYGEVKAGKSTLVNAIAGSLLSPVGFDPVTSVPIRITYGPSTAWRIGARRLDTVTDLEHAMRNGLIASGDGAAPEVVVETDLDLLQFGGQVDLVDTPGVGSAAQLDAAAADALRSLDAVVLVVRYPALFTQFTRQVMESLQTDIGKLFVVWNLDADCAELSPEERLRHAETLRSNVAGAHELFLVDARAGLRAMQADDAAGSVASGLSALIAALTRFVRSGGRDVAALREAAKRAQQRLAASQQALTARTATLDEALAAARARLQAVETTADAEAAAAREQFAEFDAALTRVGQQTTSAANKLAADFRRQLRGARRRWMRSGHLGALESAITAAAARYADAVEGIERQSGEAVHTAAAQFGTAVPNALRGRSEPRVAPLAPADRSQRATQGRYRLLRRAVWHRWYLPGVAALEGTGIATELAEQRAWLQAVLQAGRDAAGATLARRLAEITQRAAAETEAIKLETNFAPNQAEVERLRQDVPAVAAHYQAITQVNTEARRLL
jgi:hypothetical protein